MGIPVLILGESGSGKSTSLRNFTENEVGIFNVAGKPLPFRKKLPKADNARYDTILKSLSKPNLKTYVIDDSQYLMAFEAFDRAKETGYGKFTDMALHFRNLIDFVVRYTPPDVIVYFLHHTEKADDGRLKAKTQGKMLDSQLTVEGLFSIVLLCVAAVSYTHLDNLSGTEENFQTIVKTKLRVTCSNFNEISDFEIPKEITSGAVEFEEFWQEMM